MEKTKVHVVKTNDGWAMNLGFTPEANRIKNLFGTIVLPLPLTSACSREDALSFAATTDFGKLYGVR